MRMIRICVCLFAITVIGCGSDTPPPPPSASEAELKEAMMKDKSAVFDERGKKNRDKSK